MKTILLILLAVWGATSSPEAAINQLEEFTVYIEANYEDWSNNDWDKASKSYDTIKKDLKKHKFSNDQLQEVGRYQGRCTVVFSKHYVDKTEEALKRSASKVEGFFEGLSEGLGK